MPPPVFLTAEWRHLLMLNYAVDPAILRPLVPPGLELDFLDGQTFVSIVGFQFSRTRILGVPVPFHTDFEEVNLRFYVRRRTPFGWRRGVVFIRELAPRRAIAFIARTFYGEPYTTLPMSQALDISASGIRVEYRWLRAGRRESIRASAPGRPEPIAPGSKEEFITEHYWGYTARGCTTAEYQVDHPRWSVWPDVAATLDADAAALYGPPFSETLQAPPAFSLIAEGSPIAIRWRSLRPSPPARVSPQ